MLHQTVEQPQGSAQLPLTVKQLDDKFRSCTSGILDLGQTERSLRRLHALEKEVDCRSLIAELTTVGRRRDRTRVE